jgi:hypothetical protein
VQHDDRDVRQVLVVDERREAELELRGPEVERVLAVREGLRGALDEEPVEGVVVVAGDREVQLGEEGDQAEDDDRRDEGAEEQPFAIEGREPVQRVGEGRTDELGGGTSRASRRWAVANSAFASAV